MRSRGRGLRSVEELAGGGLGGLGRCGGQLHRSNGGVELLVEERPAAGGAADGALAGGFGGDGFAARVHESSELVEAVGGGQAGGGEFPEGLLGL